MSFLKWLDKNFEYVCLAFFLVIMTVLSFANVILRYCFKSPLGWSDEICCYCLALSAFFCLSCSIRHRSAIRVDTLTVMLPKAVKNVLQCHYDRIYGLLHQRRTGGRSERGKRQPEKPGAANPGCGALSCHDLLFCPQYLPIGSDHHSRF